MDSKGFQVLMGNNSKDKFGQPSFGLGYKINSLNDDSNDSNGIRSRSKTPD